MMRPIAILFALLFPFAACAVETAKEEAPPFLGGFLRESWVLYPLDVDGWEMYDEHRYDEAGAGVSVRFARKGDDSAWIDVFFYPVGALDDAQAATLAEGEREGLLAAWGKTMRDPGDMTPLATVSIPRSKTKDGKDVNVTAHILDFAYRQKDEPLSSAMVVAVHNLYAVKLRYSAYESKVSRTQARATLEAFVRALIPELEIQSNGTCFSPPPIEVLAGGAPEPTGALAVNSIDGVKSTWMFADRIVVRSAEQEDAKLAQYLTMSMTNRFYPGCDGPKELTPTAPEGKRLIRMEYSAPKPEGNTPDQPARPSIRAS